jgi:hypothetical protein
MLTTCPVFATAPTIPVPTVRRIGLTEPPSRIWLTSSPVFGSVRKMVPRSASVSLVAVLRMIRRISVGSKVVARALLASRMTISLTILARVTETSARTRSRTCPANAEIASESERASGKRSRVLRDGALEDVAQLGRQVGAKLSMRVSSR